MRIQHNIMAMNAYRNYNTNTSALSKNLEKLSSGYKINRAGDDAAGLAISEKMRAQITGLDKAQDNAKDGISLVQTAEGALTEVHDMLNRMYSLAEQSANGTYEDETDRAQLQKEVAALKEEINRIAGTANFNGIKLFTGGDTTASAADVAATMDETNAAALKSADWAFDAGVTDEVKKAFNEAMDGKAISVEFADEGDTNVGNGDSVKITGIQDLLDAGYEVTFKDASSKDAAVTEGGTINIKTGASDGELADSVDGITLTIKDKDGNAVGTLDVKFAEASDATSGTTAINFAAPTEDAAGGADAASAPTFTAGTELADDFEVAGLDFSNFKGEVTEETDVKMAYTGDNTDGTLTITIGGATYSAKVGDTSGNLGGKQIQLKKDGTSSDDYITVTMGQTVTLIGTDKNTTGDSIGEATVGTLAPAAEDDTAGTVNIPEGEIWLQIGEDANELNRIKVNIGQVDTKALNIDDIDIGTQNGALNALDAIKKAINQVSGIRGDLGAVQNRLDHTINNLSVMQENIQDAESTIRDTDIADEMMAYTKNNILIQSAQAMLAQANQVPQGVLQLLQ